MQNSNLSCFKDHISNGYIDLPNGLKMAWGSVGQGQSPSVTFPITFSATPKVFVSSTWNTSDANLLSMVRSKSRTPSGFIGVDMYSDTKGTTWNVRDNTTNGFDWLAIGM